MSEVWICKASQRACLTWNDMQQHALAIHDCARKVLYGAT